ncbi:MAG: epoxyqueuosine reductase [Epulopiscium sp. Nuni2H_MBin001]|nr:MAG: epoxyqueuosine reductase [Epulopiscium sp. Nuni2H_MBin001]
MSYRARIEQFCYNLGLDTFGFIPYRRYDELEAYLKSRPSQNEFEEKDISKRVDPSYLMPNVQTILCIAFPYNDGKSVNNGFSIYTQRLDYHKVVRSYLDKICEFINSLGAQGVGFVDNNCLNERYLAYLSGIGFIGRNNMLITKKYGSYVFLAEILIDIKIDCNEVNNYKNIPKFVQCGLCHNCVKVCPTGALNDCNVCLSYLTQKKDLKLEEIDLLKGNIFGCDFCQKPCPYNININFTNLKEFKSLEFMQQSADVYMNMDNAFFKNNVKHTSCGWRGKNVIKRNATIAFERN